MIASSNLHLLFVTGSMKGCIALQNALKIHGTAALRIDCQHDALGNEAKCEREEQGGLTIDAQGNAETLHVVILSRRRVSKRWRRNSWADLDSPEVYTT